MTLTHNLLLHLPPETAHKIAMTFLKGLQRVQFRMEKKRLSPGEITFEALPGLKFRSRVGLAAGLDKDAEVFAAMAGMGFGFVEVGSVTPKPQPGNSGPRLKRLKSERALWNRMGFNNVGIAQFVRNIEHYREAVAEFPLFANLGKGKDTPPENAIDDYVACAEALKDLVEAFVINVSSPNTPGLRDLQSLEFLDPLVTRIPGSQPLLIKLAPDLSNGDIEKIAGWANEKSRVAGLVLTNTSRALADSLAKEKEGGLSGAPILERSLECVSIARKVLQRPKVIVGVGGIHDKASAQKMLDAGADLLEVYTAFIYQGPALIEDLSGL